MTTKTFTLPFLDRYYDLQALAQFYHRGWHRGAGFLLLYGRHGAGKTRLLHQFLQEQAVADVFYWQAPAGDAATQLRDFSQALLRYLPYFAHTSDIVTAIEKLCFAPDSPFLADMETLFDERLAPVAQTILEAVAGGHHEPADLQQRLANPDKDWQRELYFLRLMKLINASSSVHDTLASVRVRYTMADPSLHFYYQHLKPYLGELPAGEVAVAAYASLRRNLGQTPFNALCREWVWAAFITGQLDLMPLRLAPLRLGAYWPNPEAAAEFDLVAVGTEQKRVLVGELIWENGRLTITDLEQIIGKSQRLAVVWPGWVIDLVIFGREPFPADLRAAATTAGVRLVTLAEIEPLLLTARERRRWEEAQPDPVEIEF